MFTASTMLVLVTTLLGLAKASQLETDLVSMEVSITATAELAEADYARWLCGGNPVDTTEMKCYLDSCKSTIENKACSSVNSAKPQAFGQCAAELDQSLVVGLADAPSRVCLDLTKPRANLAWGLVRSKQYYLGLNKAQVNLLGA